VPSRDKYPKERIKSEYLNSLSLNQLVMNLTTDIAVHLQSLDYPTCKSKNTHPRIPICAIDNALQRYCTLLNTREIAKLPRMDLP